MDGRLTGRPSRRHPATGSHEEPVAFSLADSLADSQADARALNAVAMSLTHTLHAH